MLGDPEAELMSGVLVNKYRKYSLVALSGQISIIPKPECFGDFGGTSRIQSPPFKGFPFPAVFRSFEVRLHQVKYHPPRHPGPPKQKMS